jgi:hypothetical protein
MADPIYIQVTVPTPIELQTSTPAPVEVSIPAIGIQGLSAYRVAVVNGFVGTEEQWLVSLQSTVPGDQGIQGEQGDQGIKGEQGDQGIKGDDGAQGLKGDTGEAGSDANVTSINIQSALGFVPQPEGDYILKSAAIAMAVAL